MTTQTLQTLTNKINKEIDFVDIKPFSHNIISLTLRQIEEHYGKEQVLHIIRTTDLKEIGWGYMIGYVPKEIEYESSSEEESDYDSDYEGDCDTEEE